LILVAREIELFDCPQTQDFGRLLLGYGQDDEVLASQPRTTIEKI
jgi:hypothetical protein